MNQVAVFVVPAALVLLQLLTGAELLADSEHTGKDALGRYFQIGGKEGPPVEIFRCTALEAEDVVDRGNHQVEVLLPVDQTAGRLFALAAMTRIHEVGEGLESKFGIWRALGIKHTEQSFRLVRVREIRIIEHNKDLEDHAEISANWVFHAGDGDGIRKRKNHF